MRAGLLLLPLLLTGCVAPAVGESAGFPRADAPGFPVEPLAPGRAPVPDRVAGSLDGTSPARGVLFVQGWAPSTGATLLVVTDPVAEPVNSVRVERPDAAAAVGATDPALGFRVTVRTPSERVCVLAREADGTVSLLAGSDPEWCPTP